MEAKDTVMNFAKQAEVMDRAKIKAGCLVKAQAEISFKMGYNQALKDIRDGLTPSDMV